MKTIVMTGGGTGGHVMPCVSVFKKMNKKWKFAYVGGKGIEKEIIGDSMPFFEVEVAKLERSMTFKNLLIPFKVIKGTLSARKALKQIKPDVVFSKGGFVSVPVVIAAWLEKIPVVLHESDLSVGLANKICSRFALHVCTSFEETAKTLKNGIHTGSPIDESFFSATTTAAKNVCVFGNQKSVLLVFGGSLGALAINNVVWECLPQLLKKFNVVHIVGKGNLNKEIKNDGYVQIEFTKQLPSFLKLANIVVMRSGSNAIFEVLAAKKPMLLIPLPKARSRGDQIENAEIFEKKGYAKVLKQENLSAKTLCDEINALFEQQENMIEKMNLEKPFAGVSKIIQVLEKSMN